MYTRRIIGKKKREPEYWFKIKEAWLEVKYHDNHDKLSKKEFFRNFLKYLEKYGITWDFKDKKGNIKIPNLKDYEYADKNRCFKKYLWDECYEQYEIDRMTTAEQNAVKAYKKSIAKRTIKRLEQIEELDEHEDKLIKQQKEDDVHNEDKILKTEKAKATKEANIREELGLTKTKVEFDGKVKSENLNVEVKPTDQVLKEHEDSISEFVSAIIGKTETG